MKWYVAAGLDPARFWDLTPRLYALEMAGALERLKRQSSMVWWGAMMPHMKKPPTFDDFVHGAKSKGRRDRGVAACIAAWDKLDRALIRRRQQEAKA